MDKNFPSLSWVTFPHQYQHRSFSICGVDCLSQTRNKQSSVCRRRCRCPHHHPQPSSWTRCIVRRVCLWHGLLDGIFPFFLWWVGEGKRTWRLFESCKDLDQKMWSFGMSVDLNLWPREMGEDHLWKTVTVRWVRNDLKICRSRKVSFHLSRISKGPVGVYWRLIMADYIHKKVNKCIQILTEVIEKDRVLPTRRKSISSGWFFWVSTVRRRHRPLFRTAKEEKLACLTWRAVSNRILVGARVRADFVHCR